jgi:hypothetical protein
MSFSDRFDRRKRRKPTRTMRVGYAFFWILVLAFAYFVPLGPNWNSESHLFLTFAIVDHHSLQIDPYHQALGDESYWKGHYYSDKAPGMSLIAVPAYAVLSTAFHMKGKPYVQHTHDRFAIQRNTDYLRYGIIYLMLIMPAAIFGVLLWLFFASLIGSQTWAMALTAAYSLGTIAWVYSFQWFSHQIAAMLLFGAFLVIYKRIKDKDPEQPVMRAATWAGLLAGLSVICEYPTGLIALLLACYLAAVASDRKRTLLAFARGIIPMGLIALGYNFAAFGKPFATGYTYVNSVLYHAKVVHGGLGILDPRSYGVQPPTWNSLWQITFGAYRGLFLVAPVLLLFFVALPYMWRAKAFRRELWLCAAVVGLYFLMDASRGIDQNGWSGGACVASRHLTPMIPFMIVPLAFGLRDRIFRGIFLVFATVSIAVMTAVVVGGAQFTIIDQNPLVNETWHNLVKGKVLFNWGYFLGQSGLRSVIPFLILVGLLVWRIVWLFRSVPSPDSREPARRRTTQLEAARVG